MQISHESPSYCYGASIARTLSQRRPLAGRQAGRQSSNGTSIADSAPRALTGTPTPGTYVTVLLLLPLLALVYCHVDSFGHDTRRASHSMCCRGGGRFIHACAHHAKQERGRVRAFVYYSQCAAYMAQKSQKSWQRVIPFSWTAAYVSGILPVWMKIIQDADLFLNKASVREGVYRYHEAGSGAMCRRVVWT